MKNNVEKALSNFIDEPQVEETNKKLIRCDHSIVERLDRIIIAENGKQLLREQY